MMVVGSQQEYLIYDEHHVRTQSTPTVAGSCYTRVRSKLLAIRVELNDDNIGVAILSNFNHTLPFRYNI